MIRLSFACVSCFKRLRVCRFGKNYLIHNQIKFLLSKAFFRSLQALIVATRSVDALIVVSNVSPVVATHLNLNTPMICLSFACLCELLSDEESYRRS